MENAQALSAQDLPPEEQKTTTKDPVVKTLIKVFWVLLIVTVVEVALALIHYATLFPPRPILNAVFIGLTIVKAVYIVGEFMHLKHELRNLIWMILIPLVFLFWAIVAVLYEGSTTKTARQERSTTTETTVPWENVKHEVH